MTCYNLSALIGGKFIFKKKKILYIQDLLSGLNAVISTNESTDTMAKTEII